MVLNGTTGSLIKTIPFPDSCQANGGFHFFRIIAVSI